MVENKFVIEDLYVHFDSGEAFKAILSYIAIKATENSYGLLHPSEVVNVARTILKQVFNTLIVASQDENILKDMNAYLIVTTELSKLINKDLINSAPEVKEKSSIILH